MLIGTWLIANELGMGSHEECNSSRLVMTLGSATLLRYICVGSIMEVHLLLRDYGVDLAMKMVLEMWYRWMPLEGYIGQVLSLQSLSG